MRVPVAEMSVKEPGVSVPNAVCPRQAADRPTTATIMDALLTGAPRGTSRTPAAPTYLYDPPGSKLRMIPYALRFSCRAQGLRRRPTARPRQRVALAGTGVRPPQTHVAGP